MRCATSFVYLGSLGKALLYSPPDMCRASLLTQLKQEFEAKDEQKEAAMEQLQARTRELTQSEQYLTQEVSTGSAAPLQLR